MTKKQTGKIAKWVSVILALIVTVAIGGAFVNGMFLAVPILKYLPLIAHQVVGWVLIVGAVVNLVLGLMK